MSSSTRTAAILVRPKKTSADRGVNATDQAEEQEQGAEAGRRVPVKVQNPLLPSRAEVEEHELTHLPYRSWCSHCVRAKGRAADHRRQHDRLHDIRELHLDYCFMGTNAVSDSINPKLHAILAVKDKDTRMLMGTVVPKKGSTHEFVAKRLVAFISELG